MIYIYIFLFFIFLLERRWQRPEGGKYGMTFAGKNKTIALPMEEDVPAKRDREMFKSSFNSFYLLFKPILLYC